MMLGYISLHLQLIVRKKYTAACVCAMHHSRNVVLYHKWNMNAHARKYCHSLFSQSHSPKFKHQIYVLTYVWNSTGCDLHNLNGFKSWIFSYFFVPVRYVLIFFEFCDCFLRLFVYFIDHSLSVSFDVFSLISSHWSIHYLVRSFSSSLTKLQTFFFIQLHSIDDDSFLLLSSIVYLLASLPPRAARLKLIGIHWHTHIPCSHLKSFCLR